MSTKIAAELQKAKAVDLLHVSSFFLIAIIAFWLWVSSGEGAQWVKGICFLLAMGGAFLCYCGILKSIIEYIGARGV